MSDPTKPKTKNITVNRLPADIVIGFKALAIQLDTSVETLMEVVMLDAVQRGQEWFPEVHRLNKFKMKARQEQRIVNNQLRDMEKLMENSYAG